MNSSELSSRVAARASVSKGTAATIVGAVLSFFADALARGESIAIAGFAAFTIRTRATREGRNPAIGARTCIGSSRFAQLWCHAEFSSNA